MIEELSLQAAYQQLRTLAGDEEFDPQSMADTRRIVYTKLAAPVVHRTVLGDPSVSTEALQALALVDAPYGKFAQALIAWRRAWKKEWTERRS